MERRHRVASRALKKGAGEAKSAGLPMTGATWKNRQGVCCVHRLDIEERIVQQ